MGSSMGQKKTLYVCVILMMIGFNCVHGRTLKNMKVVDDKINVDYEDTKEMVVVAEKEVQLSRPPPPSPQEGGKGVEDFRPTTPGHSPGIGHKNKTLLYMAQCTLTTLVLLLIVMILSQKCHIIEGRHFNSKGISSIPKKLGGHSLNISTKLETEDHSLDAFRPTKPGNSPGIGH
ncbi:unnamed protein product [Cochlearia groenlandica]